MFVIKQQVTRDLGPFFSQIFVSNSRSRSEKYAEVYRIRLWYSWSVATSDFCAYLASRLFLLC